MLSKLVFIKGSPKELSFYQKFFNVYIRPSSSVASHKEGIKVYKTPLDIDKHIALWDKANAIYFGPQRDLVNYPIFELHEAPPPTRFHFIPESWFDAFYNKTGVTGPYMFLIGFNTFLLSKELWIIDHQFAYGLCVALVITGGLRKLIPKLEEWNTRKGNELLNYEKAFTIPLKKWKEQSHAIVKDVEQKISSEDGQKLLYQAKKENVDLQLESIYRKRMHEVYQSVKRRLDYHMEVDKVKRQVQQKHMVNWIVDNVVKGITPQQEKDSLLKCISDLKSLATKVAPA